MDLINAIAKVRFSSAKPQRVQLHKSKALLVELLCMEPGQQLSMDAGEWTYYVVTGTASVTHEGETSDVPTGHFAAIAPVESTGAKGDSSRLETSVLANATERRLVCLVVTAAP